MATPKYLLVDGCPAPYDVAPYIYLVLRGAGQTASSIYRGSDPAALPLLRRYGKHTQAEIHKQYPTISNPEGYSQHDLHDDSGRPIDDDFVGVDSGTNDAVAKNKITNSARKRGLRVHHPYPRGVEGHHWQFVVKPRPNKRLTRTRVAITRAALRASTRKQMKGHW